ncbi:interferon-induced 35 kDa protein [Paramormyrops kingsleyae]|uniref:interferon-induced 35 kDa protein n=1 Tax=Paramormyrops kingsleyae TaxID=1676925 RepID=UPI003B97680A
MSSEEDYSLVSEIGLESPSSLEEIGQEIENHKEKHRQLIADQEEISKAIEASKHFADEFRQRAISQGKMQLEDEQEQAKHRDVLQGRLLLLQQESSRLEEEELKAMQALHGLEEMIGIARQETQLPTAAPEKNVIFTGAVSDEEVSCNFDIKPHILYPMDGGTALLTFEEEEVAEKIMSLKQHEVSLGECFIRLQAEPVWVLQPSRIEVSTYICPKRILVSNLPTTDTSRTLDKLEIHFSKSRNGGGEVEAVEFLQDSSNVVITFVQDSVAKALTDRLSHDVDFGTGRKQRVHVNPFMNGEITALKTRVSKSIRTVLLSGIPIVMEQEDLQDHLEIHFQKAINGGGEIDAITYNPLGQRKLAVFLEDCPSP